MKVWLRCAVLAMTVLVHEAPPAMAQTTASATTQPPAEATANTQAFPKQILKTGVNLNATRISPNSLQLADDMGLTAVLERVQTLRSRVESMNASAERTEAKVDLFEARQQAGQLIMKANLEIDFVLAEMNAEQNVYNEILGNFTSSRDKMLARTNAASFMANGVLWAVCEGLDIPTYKYPRLSISSGITGILAGIVPSIASMYTLKEVNGKKKTSEVEPNMLAKLFDYPVNADIEYPNSVWRFLKQTPDGSSKSRLDQLVDRWISDSNIPNFTNRGSKEQLDVLTASIAQKKGLSIATLNTRQVMLQQLSAEVLKMKRLLLELSMVLLGDKQMIAMPPTSVPTSKLVRPLPLADSAETAGSPVASVSSTSELSAPSPSARSFASAAMQMLGVE